jgi:hypothetical protein
MKAIAKPANAPIPIAKFEDPLTGTCDGVGVEGGVMPPVPEGTVLFAGAVVGAGMLVVSAVTVLVSVVAVVAVVSEVSMVSVVSAGADVVGVVLADTVARYLLQRANPPEMAELSSPAPVQALMMQPAPKPWISAVDEHWHPTSLMGQPAEEMAVVRQA